MLDLLPRLRPRVRRGDITDLLAELKAAAAIEPVDADRFHVVLDHAKAASFYLSKEQCDQVNELVDGHWRRRREAGAMVWVVEPKLELRPLMSGE